MAGRKPKPTAVKQLTGNPGKRPINKAEPKPERGAPDAPKHLTAEARAEWRRIEQQLDQLGLLTRVDAAAFEGYCEAYSTFVRAKAIVVKAGMTYTTGTGQVKKHPAVQIMAEAQRLMRQYAAEFGLTPSSRSRVAAQPIAPTLPGADSWPQQRDPTKPTPPIAGAPEEFTDADYFGGRTIN